MSPVATLIRDVVPLGNEHVSGSLVPQQQSTSVRQRIVDELRWAFTAPYHWLGGVALNVAFSLLYLAISPLAHPHRQFAWVVLVGTYFASFALADVTTTNILGPDAQRVRAGLAAGRSMLSILLIKNLVLLIVAGVPTLLLTAILAHAMPLKPMLETLLRVALPMLCWIGVGNLTSVLLAVEIQRLIWRWRRLRSRANVLWLAHLVLPYALYYLVAPIDGEQHDPLHRFFPQLDRTIRVTLDTGGGIVLWAVCTVLAAYIVRRRGVRFY